MDSFYPRTRWARSIARAPLVLWRLGLGPVIGRLMLVLTTTGRKSGLPRQAMVEYHMFNGRKYAPSGFGAQAQYYQNIMVNPYVTIQTAAGTERAIAARVTDDEELLAVFEQIKRDDPAFLLNSYFRSLGIEPTNEDILAHKDRIYLLRFDPVEEKTPPGLEVDLAWLWPVVLAGLVGFWWIQSRFK